MMTSTPVIGITTYGRTEFTDFTLPAVYFTMPAVYVDAVRRAGAIPLLIPPGEPHLHRLLPLLDGLIISGGGDLDPAHYASKGHPTVYMIDPERDASELALTRAVAASDLPLLCICRGLQVLNVALGGSLVEHLPDEVDGSVAHRKEQGGPIHHPVQIHPGSQAAVILGAGEIEVISWHHQAIRRLAPGLTVTASAADGTVEAVELPGRPNLLAVQWHPEMSAADDPRQQRLFDALAAAAAAYRQRAILTTA